jgi:L-lysine exporter family protein LysE/ArgO
MPYILLQGFLFGLAWVAPIGTANLFVINTATHGDIKYILKVTTIIVLFDIPLLLACFTGIGIIFDVLPILKIILLVVGCIMITIMGIQLIVKKKEINIGKTEKISLIKIISASLAVTWLNPQALIDGTILFGGIRSTLPENTEKYFIIGVCFAAIIWFNTLSLITFKILDKFKTFIKYINIVCGIVMILFGIKLGYSFVKIILQ